MTIILDQIDAFTSEPFKGNAAGVCLLDDDHRQSDPVWQQAVAAEMNLSETAFVWNDGMRRKIRYFTPTVEIEFCGHATVATAHCLWSRGIVPADQPIQLITYAGCALTCTRGADGRIEMDAPRCPLEIATDEAAIPGPILAIAERVAVVKAGHDWIVEFPSAAAVEAFKPDFAAISGLQRGLLITAPGDQVDLDFVSRCFFPGQGIPEDPVTGSAHCALGPYWAEKLGRNRLVAQQRSARGGEIYVHVCNELVRIAGYACTVVRGEFFA